MPKSVVNWTEHHLRYPEKRDALTPEGKIFFWSQREWHPMVQMLWNNETRSDGAGMLTFPNGRKHFYNGLTNQGKK